MSEPVTSASSSSSEGRQANGQFARGNHFGPGNPFARKCAAFRAALMDAVTEQDIQDIAVKLRDDAKAGDKAAVKLLFQYVIGKPQPAVDPDTLDIQEMRTYLGAAFPPEVLEEMQRAVPLSLLLKVWPFFLFLQEQTNTDRAARRAAKRDEKQRRRAERRQEARPAPTITPAPMDDSNQATTPTSAAPPSTNGSNGNKGLAHAAKPPSTNGDLGEHTLKMILNWLRRPRGSATGDEQS